MLTIIELIFCIIVFLLIVQICKRRFNTSREDNGNINNNPDLERFRRRHPSRSGERRSARTYQSTANNVSGTNAINIPERRELIKKNLFVKSISGEKSVLDLAHLLAISRGADLENGVSDAALVENGPIEKEVAITETTGDIVTADATADTSPPPSAPPPHENDTIKLQILQEPPSTTEETTSLRNLLSNLKNVSRRFSHNTPSDRMECSICLEHFETNDRIGWAKDGGDATSVSNEGFADTGCDHIFHEGE